MLEDRNSVLGLSGETLIRIRASHPGPTDPDMTQIDTQSENRDTMVWSGSQTPDLVIA